MMTSFDKLGVSESVKNMIYRELEAKILRMDAKIKIDPEEKPDLEAFKEHRDKARKEWNELQDKMKKGELSQKELDEKEEAIITEAKDEFPEQAEFLNKMCIKAYADKIRNIRKKYKKEMADMLINILLGDMMDHMVREVENEIENLTPEERKSEFDDLTDGIFNFEIKSDWSE